MNDFEEFENLEEEEETTHKMNCKYVICMYTCCVTIVITLEAEQGVLGMQG